MFDADATAITIMESQGINPAQPPTAYYLACCLLGSARVQRVPGLRARARRHEGGIQVRDGLPSQAENFLVAHELAEHLLAGRLFQDELIEQRCDELAAALIAPAPALRRALKAVGRHLPSLAELLGTTQSIAVLRLGEVTGTPLALVTPRQVYVRGEEYGWQGDAHVRAVASGRRLPEGLERSCLTDAPRRIALVGA